MKMVKRHKKASLIAAVALLFVAAIGVTFAFSSDRSQMPNQFNIADYETVFTDNFTAPTNWTTCETKEKTVTVKNESDVPIVARIRLDEQWLDGDDQELPLISITSSRRMAIINYTENSGWTMRGEYLYYDDELAPGAVTSSPITGVTLNCEANLGDGLPSDIVYGGAEYHLMVTAQTLQASAKHLWDTTGANVVFLQANRDFYIDFTKKAMISDDIFEANGNGVNAYKEKGETIYYYRGNVDNNNVIWGNLCWKIIRTTYTGGVKMIYNGAPTTVDGKQQCLATGAAADINNTVYRYNGSSYSPADVGYKYGDRVQYAEMNAGSTTFIFSNDVSRSGNTYTLDTSDGQSITGTWADKRMESAVRYHYFCTNGASVCNNTQIGYIYIYGNSIYDSYGMSTNTIFYLPVGGYDDIEAVKDAMFSNNTDSIAKSTIEAWFVSKGLDALENDLEDAVYCNDRTFAQGALAGKDSSGLTDKDTSIYFYGPMYDENIFGEYYRNWIVRDGNNNPVPTFECPNLARDGFTKSASNGNGQLAHKVGLITGAEMVLAGAAQREEGSPGDTDYYLYNAGRKSWSISPWTYDHKNGMNFVTDGYIRPHGVYDQHGLRPVVTLRAGMKFNTGDGLKTNPYIAE